jgi:2-dehydropantoate 2-reductase
MVEIQAGAKAHMIEIEDSFLNKQFSLTQPMGPYKPSSLIDFLSQKAVEVDAIWGEPLRRAEKLGVQMPELKKLHSQLLHLTYKA